MPNLTKTFVEKLEPQDKDYIVWDSKLTGFGVKVTPKGRKVYILKYRNKEGRQRKPAIGTHGKGTTCEIARKTAEDMLADKTKGKDPSGARQTLRNSPTMTELCDRFLKEYSKVYKKPRSVELDTLHITKHIKPHIGTLKAVSITKEDISKLHARLEKTPTTANRVVTLLSKIFNLSEEWHIRPQNSNPVRNVNKYKEERRERYLTKTEIKRLADTLDRLETEGKESIYFLNLIRLLMFTGARLSEIRDAKWKWVDLKNATITLPDSKTGKKIIHLSPATIEILKNVPKVKGNPYIIVGSLEGKALNAAQKPWQRVRKIAKLEDVRIHDLRHTFASLCVAQGMSLQMVAKLLGHSQTSTSERYAHLAKESIQEATAQVGEVIVGNFKKKKSN